MAITESFVYNMAKRTMFGTTANAWGAEALASLSMSSSMKAMLVLESYSPKKTASTTTTIRAVFSSRAPTGNAAYLSNSADMVLANPTVSDSSTGVVYFDADDGAFAGSVAAGGVIGGILIYKIVNNDQASSYPIALIDINIVTANGASININWDNGVNRIFALT